MFFEVLWVLSTLFLSFGLNSRVLLKYCVGSLFGSSITSRSSFLFFPIRTTLMWIFGVSSTYFIPDDTVSWLIMLLFICRIIYIPFEAFILMSIIYKLSSYVKSQIELDTSWIIPVFFPICILFYIITAWITFLVYTNPYITILPSSLFSIFLTLLLILNFLTFTTGSGIVEASLFTLLSTWTSYQSFIDYLSYYHLNYRNNTTLFVISMIITSISIISIPIIFIKDKSRNISISPYQIWNILTTTRRLFMPTIGLICYVIVGTKLDFPNDIGIMRFIQTILLIIFYSIFLYNRYNSSK